MDNQDLMDDRTPISSDGEFFYRVTSLLYALSDAVAEPVGIRSDIPSRGKGAFSLIYYDCEDRGPAIMERRIATANNDIEGFMGFHDKFLDSFTKINTDDRQDLGKTVNGIIGLLPSYTAIIDTHQKKFLDDYFLYMPTCIGGHMDLIDHRIVEFSFNPEQTLEGVIEEIDVLKATYDTFMAQSARLKPEYMNLIKHRLDHYVNTMRTTRQLLNINA
jgi:hypothetical protein